jgi:hypothetical protein
MPPFAERIHLSHCSVAWGHLYVWKQGRLSNVPMLHHTLSQVYGLRPECVRWKDFPDRPGDEVIPGMVWWLPRRGKDR